MHATALVALLFTIAATAAPHQLLVKYKLTQFLCYQVHDEKRIPVRNIESSCNLNDFSDIGYATGPNEDAVGKRGIESSWYATGPNEDAVGKRDVESSSYQYLCYRRHPINAGPCSSSCATRNACLQQQARESTMIRVYFF
ncbi:hypothetical protein GQ53DRAFT_764648 [Thozetella sp. PMI_491]|nr:hypothetical protein GQ53DRAFT_764648 [Thozetella sp. PMI_491]